MKRDSRGYTLVELVITILIFSVVMGLISVSFNRIVTASGQVIKATETDIGGLIGLEVMRVDLSNAGMGLPWDIGSANYDECTESHRAAGIAETDATLFNDSGDNPESDDGLDHPPRAFVQLDDKGYNGSDYLVLKGTALGGSRSSRGWSYLGFGLHSTVVPKPSKSDLELVTGKRDRVIVVNSGIKGITPYRKLVTEGSSFALTFEQAENLPMPFRPKEVQDRYLVYGLAPPKVTNNAGDVITFPFNRVDYFVAPPSEARLSSCVHKNSRGENRMGLLYRGQVGQNGKFSSVPILDCVADLQVVFGLNTSADGETLVPTHLEEYIDAFLDPTRVPRRWQKEVPAELRSRVREVRAYVLAQQGKKDTGYLYPLSDPNRAIVVGGAVGRTWKASEMADTFGEDWRNYHWQVYSIVVETKNLN